MNGKNTIIEGYLDMVRKKIRKTEGTDRFIDFLREDIEEFCDSNPNCTEEDLIKEFGSPEEVARSYINDTVKIEPKALADSKKKKRALIIILAVILLIAAVVTVKTVITYIDVISGYDVIETEIEEETTD